MEQPTTVTTYDEGNYVSNIQRSGDDGTEVVKKVMVTQTYL